MTELCAPPVPQRSRRRLPLSIGALLALLAALLVGAAPPVAAEQDTGFHGGAGRVVDPLTGRFAVDVRPDGDIVSVATGGGGPIGSFVVTETHADGTLDTSVGDPGTPGRTSITVPLPAYSDDIFGPAGVGIDSAGRTVTMFSSDIGSMVTRVKADHTLDTSYGGGDGVVDDLACGNAISGTLASDDAAFTLGHPMDFQMVQCPGISIRRYDQNGVKDGSWGNQGRGGYTVTGAHFDDRLFGSEIVADSGNRIIAAGTGLGGTPRVSIIRVTANGAEDSSFSGDGLVEFDPDSGVYASFGSFANGNVGSFTEGHSTKMAMDVAVDSQDRILTIGTTCNAANGPFCSTPTSIWIARHLPNGALDTSFGTGGIARIDPSSTFDYGLEVGALPSGRVAFTGFSGTTVVKEFAGVLTADGRPDNAFGPDGVVFAAFGEGPNESHHPSALTVADDDRFYVGANRHDPTIWSYGGYVSAYDSSSRILHPVTPTRLMDTRTGLGGVTLAPGQTRTLQIAGAGGIPSSAVAAVLNVTVTGPTAAGWLTVWPTGAAMPNASSVNFVAGQTVANSIVVGVGTSGQVSISNPLGSTDVVVDVTGWFEPSSAFTPVTPTRLMDTRSGLGGVMLAPGETRVLPVAGAGGIPSSAVAAVLNVTVTGPSAPGWLTVWPSGTATPTASSVNFVAGQTVANSIVVGVGSGGGVSFTNPVGSTHVVVDVTGWFAASSGFTPVTPTRVMDTRLGLGSTTLGAGQVRSVVVAGSSSVPSTAAAVVLNMTVTNPAGAGWLTVWPRGAATPNASSVNFAPGQTIANSVILGVGTSSGVSMTSPTTGTDAIVDLTGWFA